MPVSASTFSTRNLRFYFLSHRVGIEPDLTSRLVEFINGTGRNLDVAIYDIRDVEIVAALKRLARAGKTLRIAYDGSRSRSHSKTVDPKPPGTEDLLRKAGLLSHAKAITIPSHLMHDKFLIQDDASVWTGSANFTMGGLQLQDNNCLEARSPALAALYRRTFEGMWSAPTTPTTVSIRTSGQSVSVDR